MKIDSVFSSRPRFASSMTSSATVGEFMGELNPFGDSLIVCCFYNALTRFFYSSVLLKLF